MDEQKRHIRQRAHAGRRAQQDKDLLSREILARLRSLPEYKAAASVMFYLDIRDEVRTRADVADAMAEGKKVVVPYCLADELGLFHLERMEELAAGTWGILEPRHELRELDAKRVDVSELDLIVVPGVAFDAQGGRTGHGRAYYDKLLARARPDTPLVAVAFECQLFPEVPMADHDVFMDIVVTEQRVYRGRGRRGSAELV